MPKAAEQSTTRRALFGAAPAIAVTAGALAAIPAASEAQPESLTQGWRDFIRNFGLTHPDLGQVALKAAAAGLSAEDVTSIICTGPMERSYYPVLFVDAHNGGGHHSVFPGGVLISKWVMP